MAFGSEQWMYNAGGEFYPYEIDNSIRFDTNAYLARTPSVASNRKTWTWSSWVKRGNVGTETDTIFLQRLDSNNSDQFAIQFKSDNTLRVIDQTASGGQTLLLDTTAVFRDPSAWYHITVSIDTTNSTAGDRARLYVNGERITAFTTESTWPLNHNTSVNSTVRALIGANRGNSSPTLKNFFNGYLAEVNFVDGQALDPTDFGEFKSGVWIPKKYEGTYGTNGFYLDFGNAGSLGADVSGNGNNWTPTNLASTDQMLDSPTNNFATLNPLRPYNNFTFAEGNLKGRATSTSAPSIYGANFPRSGKYYYEFLLTIRANLHYYSVRTQAQAHVAMYRYDGNVLVDGSVIGTYATYDVGDIISFAVDVDANEVSFYKNNSLVVTVTPTTTIASDGYIHVASFNNNNTFYLNHGQDSSFAGNKTRQGNTDANGIGDFYYAPPAGYLALCSANLPAPAIDPAEDDIPADYFNPVVYTGNGSTQSITGVGFQPDFVWLKSRSQAYDHGLVDAVRGVTKFLESNTTDAEATVTNYTTSFDSDGFSLGVSNRFNQSSATNVAWNWKAGGTAVANTDGTIASQVSANTKAGFSIVTIDGLPASTLSTFGHGLGVKPDMVILKSRNNTTNWEVYHSSLTPDGERKLYLNATSAEIDSAFMGDTPPTSSVVSFNPGGSASNHVAYCFHSVEGFSKFGSYTGNGSTDGPFVYTGFRPAFVMIKVVDLAGGHWVIHDSARDEYNESQKWLFPSSSSAEQTATYSKLDLLSNGFKIKSSGGDNVNYSGYTFIYMAFAEMPFKYSLGR